MPKPKLIKPARYESARRVGSPEFQVEVDRVHAITGDLLKAKGKRTRADGDRARRADTEVLLANALHAHKLSRPGYTISRANTRTKRNRYGTTSLAPSTLSQLDLLTEANVLQQDRGYRGFPGMVPGQLTVVKPTASWAATVATFSLVDTAVDHAGDELVMLKGTKISDGEAADLIDYTDDDATHALRRQVQFINHSLATHVRRGDVEFIGDSMMSGYLVDVRDTFQRRYFSRSSFTSGGRLFGGWWKPLGKTERLRDIRLLGEPVVELDFASMGVMLAYAHAGAMPPNFDLYGPRKYNAGTPGDIVTPVTLSRETVKKLTNAMLFDEDTERNRWPRGFEKAGKGVPVHRVIDGIKELHAPIAHLFGTGFGHYGMFTESSILVEILLRLAVQGVPVLDVHESIIVAQSHEAVAMATMASVFEAHTGIPARIKVSRDDTDLVDVAAQF